MLAHLGLAGGDVAAVLADEVRVLQVHQQARLEPGHVVALWTLVQPHVQVHGVDVVTELNWVKIQRYENDSPLLKDANKGNVTRFFLQRNISKNAKFCQFFLPPSLP